MHQPLVSCIMPTANRKEFLKNAINLFLLQDYPTKELIIIDDGLEPNDDVVPNNPEIKYFYSDPIGSIGKKRNAACQKATGEIILHFDDDDWYASDWIKQQVNALQYSGADITGLQKVILHAPSLNMSFECEVKTNDKPWLCGATLAYNKALWVRYPFVDLQIGEDTDFLTNSGGKVFAIDYQNGFQALLHRKNTSLRYVKSMTAQRWLVK